MQVLSPQRTGTSWNPAGTKLWVLAVAVLGGSWHDAHSWDMALLEKFPWHTVPFPSTPPSWLSRTFLDVFWWISHAEVSRAWLYLGPSWQSSGDAARQGLRGHLGPLGRRESVGWEGGCSVPTSIRASPPGMAGANGICTVIRDLIYQPLMGSGKIEFLAICS